MSASAFDTGLSSSCLNGFLKNHFLICEIRQSICFGGSLVAAWLWELLESLVPARYDQSRLLLSIIERPSSIMPKHPRAGSRSEAIDSFFEKLFAIANVSEPEAVTILKKLKIQFLSAEAEKKKPVHKAVKKFTLTEAVQDFGLTYSYWWDIETFPETKTFQPSPCLGRVSS